MDIQISVQQAEQNIYITEKQLLMQIAFINTYPHSHNALLHTVPFTYDPS